MCLLRLDDSDTVRSVSLIYCTVQLFSCTVLYSRMRMACACAAPRRADDLASRESSDGGQAAQCPWVATAVVLSDG